MTRPEGPAAATAARLAECGHDAIVSSLLVPQAVPWTPPADPVDAIVFTSAQAPRLAGDLSAWRALPAYAVGRATAEAARAAGFADVRVGRGDADELFAQAAADGVMRPLHLTGRDRKPASAPVVTRIVYAAELAADFTDPARMALRNGAIDRVLLYSARTATHFAMLCDRHRIDRGRIGIAAISTAARDAAGPGWRRADVADRPSEDAIFAAAGLSCDKR